MAKDCELLLGVKLSNTLEVENSRSVFDETEKMMYLSGRPLHAITVNLAHKLAREFDGKLPMSFSAGASCYNVAALLETGMQTITVCSDLLKTGGYLRLLDYIDAVKGVACNPGEALDALLHAAIAEVRPAVNDYAGWFALGMGVNDAHRIRQRRPASRPTIGGIVATGLRAALSAMR